ncbi:hypothetical protein HUG20_14140 [Salicibibacter cibi]|uniref:Uncharacterized protein n=1 Tax=Salicibibacter cibi TaxID=2743001 RepID=A0A7T6ZCE0_9BACI|nr:hypothetical protein [Salicibibacter cibi]QQK80919.1 hypothetical protein HUG20_14140 [Salicibibacter cibi]
MQGNPSYKQKTLALLATYGGTVLQWRASSGKTDASSPRSAARRLDRSSAERRSHGSGIPASADSCKLFSNPDLGSPAKNATCQH